MLSQSDALPHWNFVQRLGFRLACAYFLLFFLLGFLPITVTEWVGHNLLRFPVITPPDETGAGGDSLFAFVLQLIVVVSSLFATLVWSVLDARRVQYERLLGFLRIFVRYSLAQALLGYGMVKIFNTQFALPPLLWWNATYAESSPMGLLWRFMQFSSEYVMFAGVLEALAALLLLFRNTSMLGALLATAVMTNVVMLNFCYDVPVKLYSSHLLLSGVFLVIPEIPRLLRLFVFNQAVSTRFEPVLFVSRWAKSGALGLKLVVLGMLAYSSYQRFVVWQELPARTGIGSRQEIVNQAKNAQEGKYLLFTRGFHWVSEPPVNR
jgi:hypothetical protein